MDKQSFKSDILKRTSDICILLYKNAIEDVKVNELVKKFKNCYDHIETLLDCQKEYSVICKKITAIRKEKLEKLLLVVDNKEKFGVSKSNSGNGYGLVALNNIKKYEEILRIAESNMITENDAYNSKIGSFLQSDPITRGMPNLALALYLLNEVYDCNSSHFNYIDSLPKTVDTCLYLTPENIVLLQSSQYLNGIVHQFCNICSHYCYFSRIFSQQKDLENCHFKNRFCFEDFRWAVSIIMSRNNAIPVNDGKSRILALIPIWDMMNHQFGEVTTDFDHETRSLIFYSMQDYERGDEICMDYGKRTTLQYFLYSGFVPRNNPYDIYPLKIGFNKQDSLYEKKRQILSKIDIDCDSVTFNVDYLNGVVLDESMRSYLAIMLLKTDEMLAHFVNCDNIKKEITDYSSTIEADLVVFVVTRLKVNLSCVEKVIDKIDNSDTYNVCLELLSHEREVLKAILSLFSY